MANLDLMKEVGVGAVPDFSGRFAERYSSRLHGSDGIKMMAEVLRREPSAFSLHHAVLLTAQKAEWRCIPASDKPGDKKAAEFIESCMSDMSTTWWKAVQFSLSSGPFGFADLNVVFKRRLGRETKGKTPESKFDDGLIGIRKLAPRRQETVDRWIFDEEGGPKAMVQLHPNTGQEIEIPIEKLIHVTAGDDRGGWEGLGWLEPGYNLAHLIWNLEVYAGIGWQRSLVGVPMMTYMEMPDDTAKSQMEDMMKGLVVNRKQYITVPGYLGEFKLVTVENSNADSLLNHISQLRWEMLMLMLGTYLRLGSTVSGSRALSFPLIEMFRMGVDGHLDNVRDTFNQYLVTKLIKANPNDFSNITDYPRLDHSTVLDLPTEVLTNLLNIQQFVNTADYEDVKWLRDLLGMPVYEITGDERSRKQNMDKKEEKPVPTGKTAKSEDVEDEEEDVEETENIDYEVHKRALVKSLRGRYDFK